MTTPTMGGINNILDKRRTNMLYSEILNSLYKGNIEEILSVLNKSVYSTDLNKHPNELFVIHTGVTFNTHKGKEMEIYVGFSLTSNNVIVIRQIRADWSYRWIPLLNGIVVKINTKNSYINQVDNKFCEEIVEKKDDYDLRYSKWDNLDDIFSLNEETLTKIMGDFKVTTASKTLKFPWSKKLKFKFYSDGNTFSVDDPNTEDSYGVYRRQSYEDYLKEDYGDDEDTAYWNNE